MVLPDPDAPETASRSLTFFLAAFFIFEIAVTAAAIVMVNRLSKDDRMIMQGFGGSGFLSENIFEADRRLK